MNAGRSSILPYQVCGTEVEGILSTGFEQNDKNRRTICENGFYPLGNNLRPLGYGTTFYLSCSQHIRRLPDEVSRASCHMGDNGNLPPCVDAFGHEDDSASATSGPWLDLHRHRWAVLARVCRRDWSPHD